MNQLFYRSNPWWEEEYQFTGIERTKYLEILRSLLRCKDIIFLTGLRRIGKTTLLKNLIYSLITIDKIDPIRIFYISLDMIAINDIKIFEIIREYRKIHRLSEDQKVYLFLDEIASRSDYQIELKNLYDIGVDKVFASSSSSSVMKDKNAYLTGRQRMIKVFPLDFTEYLKFRDISIKKRDEHLLEVYFKEYMKDGGMPEYVLTRDIEYLSNLVNSIIYKDIISHNNIKDEQTVFDYFKLLMERCGKQFSLNKMSKILGIGVDTAKRFLTYFEETYLVNLVERSGKLNERLRAPKKVYSGDVGIRNLTTGFRDMGAVFENLVFLKIIEKDPKYIYENGIELDFMTVDNTLIEAKYNYKLNEKQMKLFKSIECREKIIVNGVRGYLDLKG